MTNLDVRGAYSAVSDLYCSMFGSVDSVHPDDVSLIARHLGDCTGPVLDFGCGPGHLTGYLHGQGVDVRGVDLVPEFIARARATNPNVGFELAADEGLTLPGHALDGILAWYSLIHLPPPEFDRALAAFRRALRSDGVVVVGFFTSDEIGPFEHKVITAYRWPIDEVALRLRQAGFTEVERLERDGDGTTRPHAAIAARAV